jgi:hypothetical protein
MKSKAEIHEEMMNAGLREPKNTWIVVFTVLIVIGAAAFLSGISGSNAERAWQSYLINFLFWSGLAFGAVLFSATLTITQARWGRPLKRLAEAPAAFLPVAFILFWVLYFGKETIFPWIREPIPEKADWLNSGFLFARDGASLLALTVAAVALVYHSVRRDLRYLHDRDAVLDAPQDKSCADPVDPQSFLSPIFGILYALVLSLVAFDLIMSLSPHWYSTLFGAYFFVGSFYTGLAALILLSALSLKSLGLGKYISGEHFHDMGNLLLAFCLVTGDFFYAQFLVIWYGNIPEETRYIIMRVRPAPWGPLAWAVLIVCFLLPFVLLLSKKIKTSPVAMAILSGVVLVGMWFERLLLVAPSLWKGAEMPFGLLEIMITAGFFGIVALCIMLFIRRFPVLPVADPVFRESVGLAHAADR